MKHGSWDEAFGYRFQTPERVIVLSGDTAPADAVVAACSGCDLLLHKVYGQVPSAPGSPPKSYFAAFHTSSEEVVSIAARAKPKLLVLYHQILAEVPEGELLRQVRHTIPEQLFLRGDNKRECRCTPGIIQRYLAKVSGPLLDRIDHHIEVPAVPHKELHSKHHGSSSADIRERVEAAREIQRHRGFYNAQIPPSQLRSLWALDDSGERTARDGGTPHEPMGPRPRPHAENGAVGSGS